jgi:DNA polymerase III subunit tau-like protein
MQPTSPPDAARPRADDPMPPSVEPAARENPARPNAQAPAAAEPPAAAAGAAAAPAAPDTALSELLAAWPAIVEHLSAHPPTKPLIVNSRPVAVDGAIVTLGFPEEQAFLKDQAERRRPGIEAGIAAVVGHPVTVRCVVANIELPPVGDDLVAEARRIFADDLADVGEVS